MHRERCSVLLVVIVAASRAGVGWGAPVTPRLGVPPLGASTDSCTAALLARTPPYDSTKVLTLAGEYRWIWVDTVSTRRPDRLPPALRLHSRPAIRRFRLWQADTIAAQPSSDPRLRRRWVGQVAGAIVGADTAGFGPSRPQLEISGRGKKTLNVVYDRRVWEGMLDGGDVVDFLSIDVAGSWGFGGYHVRHSQFYVVDLDGKPIPSFAGYYCAMRVGTRSELPNER